MRFSGSIVVVALLLFVLLTGAWYMQRSSQSQVDGVADLQDAEVATVGLQEILSGDFKRKPKKNPALGKGRLRGIVRKAEGLIVKDATVQVTPIDLDANILDPKKPIPHFWETETDKYGVFSVSDLRPGAYVVSASDAQEQAVAVAEVTDSGAFEELTLSLVESVGRRGTVMSLSGNPVVGARVIPINGKGPMEAYRYTTVVTDERGSFFHSLVPEGNWDALIVAEGHAPKRITLAATEPTPVQLGNGESLRGRILREDDERPLNNTRVELTALDEGGERYSMRTNGQGYFLFNDLRVGDYRLEVNADRYVAELTCSVPRDDTNTTNEGESTAVGGTEQDELVLVARPASSIRGRALALDAEFGVPDVRIEAFVEGAPVPAAVVTTDQAGYYQFTGLKAQPYRIVASVAPPSDTILSSDTDLLDLARGERAAGPEFRVVRGQIIRGTILDVRGMGVADANVLIARSGYPGAPERVASDGEGRFAISGIRDQQEITIWAEKLDQTSQTFGPVAVGTDGLEGIVLRFSE